MSWRDYFDIIEDPVGSPEWYLSHVADWTDPNPPLVVEQYDDIYVVRDDLLVGGTKERIYDYMIKKAIHVKEFVYGGGSRFGFGQIGIAAVCKKYGKKATIFVAKGKELHPSSKKAQSLGANIIECPNGMLTVTTGRAKRYVSEDPHRKLVEFSGDPIVIGSVMKVAKTLPFEPDVICTVAGSGVLNKGLQLAFPNALCYAISIGHNLSAEERGRAIVIKYPLPFATECKSSNLPPFPSSKNYDAKGWKPTLEIAKEHKGKTILFWNVG